MIIGASLALRTGLIGTGGADYLAHLLVSAISGPSPILMMSGLMLLMALLNNIVSRNAAAIIGTPSAIQIAFELGVSPKPFVIAVLFGAHMGFATPVAYRTNVLKLAAGGCKFTEFLRVGVPLTLIVWIAYAFLAPKFFPL